MSHACHLRVQSIRRWLISASSAPRPACGAGNAGAPGAGEDDVARATISADLGEDDVARAMFAAVSVASCGSADGGAATAGASAAAPGGGVGTLDCRLLDAPRLLRRTRLGSSGPQVPSGDLARRAPGERIVRGPLPSALASVPPAPSVRGEGHQLADVAARSACAEPVSARIVPAALRQDRAGAGVMVQV